jgi:membrane AbrB-like protein
MVEIVKGLAIYLLVGTAGGLICTQLKVPAGAMIGSMMAVILLKLLVSAPIELPKGFALMVQILLGILIGATFQREMLREFHVIALPVVSSTLALVGVGLLLTALFYKMAWMDVGTAYLGTNPGAMSVLMLLSIETGSNPPVVLSFHFFRVVFVVLTAPWIFRLISRWT